MPDFLQRLDRIERTCRMYRGISVIVLAVAVTLVVGGAQRDGVQSNIKAQNYSLVDKDGRLRAQLNTTEAGTSQLCFYDNNSAGRLALALERDGSSSLVMVDRKNVVRLMLGVEPNGSGTLNLFDKEGNGRIDVVLAKDDTPAVAFFDKNQILRMILACDSDGNTKIESLDKDRNVIYTLSSSKGLTFEKNSKMPRGQDFERDR